MRVTRVCALLVLGLIPAIPAQGVAQETDEAAVRHVAETFLLALSAADTATLSSLLAPQAMLHSVRDTPEGPSIGPRTAESFLNGLGGDDRRLLERMWNPTVLVEGRVAMVWAPYDFHLNGEFSHCGIDVFTLLKDTEGWKVTGVIYNVVREGCAPSPLGPPGGGTS